MGTKLRVPTVTVIFSVLVLFAGFTLAKQDQELKRCQHQCKVAQKLDEEQRERCARECKKYYGEKEEGKGEEEEEEGWKYWSLVEDPRQKLRKCHADCERVAEEDERVCQQRCEMRWVGEEEEGRDGKKKEKKKEKEKEEGKEEHNPYVFEKGHFDTRAKGEGGSVFLLPKFTERSELLQGIENYRLGLLVANPNTFVSPVHMDADAVFFVTWGKGTVTLIRENKRESFNVERGHIFRIPPGTPVYLINRDDNEKLYIVKLIKTINLPGHYEAFSCAGGKNPESLYTAFSWEILEAALKTSRDKLENLFKKQDQGYIFEASREQIKALSQHEEGGSGSGKVWPFGSESRNAFNLLNQRPSQSNNYGKLFEADSGDFKPLRNLDLLASYVNITKGSMSGPFYNSKSTLIAIIVKGEGYLEMACPHVSDEESSYEDKQSGSGSSPSYQKINSRLRTDTVFVVPPGHPFVTVASKNDNLELACFEVNAEGNVRYPLAGKWNVVKSYEREAKELAFKSKVEEVDQVFGNQDDEMFFAGPEEEEGRAFM